MPETITINNEDWTRIVVSFGISATVTTSVILTNNIHLLGWLVLIIITSYRGFVGRISGLDWSKIALSLNVCLAIIITLVWSKNTECLYWLLVVPFTGLNQMNFYIRNSACYHVAEPRLFIWLMTIALMVFGIYVGIQG